MLFLIGVIGYIGLCLLIAQCCGINGKYDEQCQRCGSEDIIYSNGYIRCKNCGTTHIVVKVTESLPATIR